MTIRPGKVVMALEKLEAGRVPELYILDREQAEDRPYSLRYPSVRGYIFL